MIEVSFDDGGQQVPFVIAAAPTERHRMSATATEHAVERGVDLTDHVRPERRPLVLEIVLSDTPIEGGETEYTRVVDGWALLNDAMNRALVAIVVTRLETYERMVLLDAEATRTAKDGSWLRAELTFGQIRVSSSETVEAPTPIRPRDQEQEDAGSQSTTERPELRSILSRFFE